jgi:L-iditol 2-dehydrogenase
MKVAMYYKNDDVRIEEQPIPELGPGEILIKTEVCGLCGGETLEWYLASRAPMVLGHEPTGVVAATGAGVTKFREGDRAFAHHHVPCMSCHYCNRGLYTMCPRFRETHFKPGGFAEYIQVPAEIVELDTLLLPDNVTFEEGTLIEPMACCLKGVRRCNIQPGDTVAIVGLGFMGMCYLELSTISPAGKIIGLDFSDWRLEKARSLGATHTINPKKENASEQLRDLNSGRGADAVFVTAPTVAAYDQGLALCDKGARLHFGAPPHPDVVWAVHPAEIYFREISTNCSYSANHIDTAAVLDLLAAKRLDAMPLLTHQFGLDGVSQAIQLLLKADRSLKSLIYPALTGLPEQGPIHRSN